MSIEFERGDLPELGRMEMACDMPGCNFIETFEGAFRDCIDQAKEKGWGIFRIGHDEWEHYCPEHKEEASDG
jgi:hypothetical protein